MDWSGRGRKGTSDEGATRVSGSINEFFREIATAIKKFEWGVQRRRVRLVRTPRVDSLGARRRCMEAQGTRRRCKGRQGATGTESGNGIMR